VECNSITGALALGFDAGLCRHSRAASRVSTYANSASARPYADHGMRLSILLAARDVDAAQRLLDRGMAPPIARSGCARRYRPMSAS